jgi:hypothetical protein
VAVGQLLVLLDMLKHWEAPRFSAGTLPQPQVTFSDLVRKEGGAHKSGMEGAESCRREDL